MTRPMNAPAKRYLQRLAISMALYILTLFAAVHYVGSKIVTGPAAYVLAILPGICVCGVFWAVGRLIIEQTDEYQRLLLIRQTLFATAFALSLATIWGFLESVGLVPHIDAYFIAILWFAGLGVGALVNRLTIGDDGGCA